MKTKHTHDIETCICQTCAAERVKHKKKLRLQSDLVPKLAELSAIFRTCKRYKQGDGICCACTEALFETLIYFKVA